MKGQKTGGRAQGTPNKATQDVRSAIAVFALANVPKIGQWLNEVEDPAKRLDLYHAPWSTTSPSYSAPNCLARMATS